MSSARRFFVRVYGFIVPPRTVGSWAMITHSTPETTPIPVTHAGADRELRPPGRQRGQLKERGVAVEQQLDALPDQEPSATVVALRVPLAAAGAGQLQLLLERLQGLQLDTPVLGVERVRRVEA